MWREEAICQGHIFLIERKRLRLKRGVDFICLFCRDLVGHGHLYLIMFRLVSVSVGSNPIHSVIFCLYSLTFRLRHLNSVFRAHGTKFFCDSPLN